ncbi:MAG TPA: helix-turn-helix transcriptional regulator [Clostridiales bacterium]|nr:helix-turn-helix transcriptional regulator [Clostridiales bacterium]
MAGTEKSELAKTLIALRRQMGLTQEQIAKAIQVKRSTYAYYERSTNPPLKVLNKLANVFNVSLDTLIGRSSPYNRRLSNSLQYVNKMHSAPPETYANRYEKIFLASELTPDEQDLLLKYRLLPQNIKSEIQKTLEEYVKKSND